MKRPAIPSSIEVEVLTQSARRCALCFGVNNDFNEKSGQIAHLDRDSSNNSLSNLVFLCLEHHDRYDSTSSQSKGYRKAEVVEYRKKLYQAVEERLRREEILEKEASESETKYDVVFDIIDFYSSLSKRPERIFKPAISRCHLVFEFFKQYDAWSNLHLDDYADEVYSEEADKKEKQLLTVLGIPRGVYLPTVEAALASDWLEYVEYLIELWASGDAEFDHCTKLIFEIDEYYDLDLAWILYGIPHSDLPRLGYDLLVDKIYYFGMRNQSEYSS